TPPICTRVPLSSFGPIRQHFARKRHSLRASLYRKQLAARFAGVASLLSPKFRPISGQMHVLYALASRIP
ncbi:hypothetical protein M3I56_40650, partial [Paraburkholderia sp. CNPSo 3281]|nr:hypothetical protein [Paraburkholderia sp. CNPSo 3281]